MSCTEYQYRCLQCGRKYAGSRLENSYRLSCDDCGERALLEAEYSWDPSAALGGGFAFLGFDSRDSSLFRYRKWLPVYCSFQDAPLPKLIPSKAIACEFGLEDLDLLFSGYAPELGAYLRSTTFKELEAYSIFAHTHGCCAHNGVLVVASAGNTARAFAEVALKENLAVLLVVPDTSLDKMHLSFPQNKNSKVIFVASTRKNSDTPSDYAEAIAVSKILCESPHFFSEGGVKNIARRDGLGVGYLHAQYMRWQRNPTAPPYRYYFQGIGSGTGAIGSYSMYRRLKQAGCMAQDHQFSLMLAQNAPFIPVVEHWRERREKFCPYESAESLRRNKEIVAAVLANRSPPYDVVGGLADLLKESGGDAFAVSNAEITEMQELFSEKEGLELVPAAAVAAAALRQAVTAGRIPKDKPVLLHLTGGGQMQLARDFPQSEPVRAACTVDWRELENSPGEQRKLIRDVEQLFGF